MKDAIVPVLIILCFLLSPCVPSRQIRPAPSPVEPVYTAPATPSVTQPATKANISKRLDDQLDYLADQIVNDLAEGKKSKIAITQFSNLDGNVSRLGKYVSEELTTRLYRAKRFQMVERELLAKVMEEHKLNLSGLIDESTAVEVGRILGVDALCTGTISDLGMSLKVNARMISMEKGSIFAVASAEIFKDSAVNALLLKNPGEAARPAAAGSPETPFKNLTPLAAITASTVYGPRFDATNIGDGIAGVINRGEWATRNQRQGAWILLRWPESKIISKVILHDRANKRAQVLEGTLSFSDGSAIKTGQLPNRGAPKEFTFSPKYVEWMQFTVDAAKGINIGLSEIQVFGR